MSKFKSNWIERNVYYRTKPGTNLADNHFEQCERPLIVCLCGSTRFKDAWHAEMKRLTQECMAIVLAVGDLDPRPEARNVNVPVDPELKVRLDELHKRKIDLADSVLILNVGGYVGDSTRSEVLYAERYGKPVVWLEPFKVPPDLAHIGNSLSDGPMVHRDRDNDPDYVGA
jgi:hypothetical protein